MDIVHILLTGLVKDIPEIPERHIETVMSDVFIYPHVVRKVYKKDREGVFLDLRDTAVRKQFYKDDFFWNQDVSGDIHLGLYGVRANEDGTYELCEAEEAAVWLIEMKRIEDSDTLFRRLREGSATVANVSRLAQIQTEGLQRLTDKKLVEYTDLLDIGLQALWEMRLDVDLRRFGKSFGKEIPEAVTDARIDTLLNFFRTNTFLQNLSSADAAIAIDNHAGNVVFHEDEPQFIDIYLVKREWRLIDKHNNIARIATCVRVLGNDELADAMYEAYREYAELAPREVYEFEEAYNALIKGYYYTYLKQPEVATKYFTFADGVIEKLEIV